MGSPQQGSEEQNQAQCEEQRQERDATPGEPPPPPEPEKDPGIIPPVKSPVLEGLDELDPDNINIFKLDAVAALKLLCRNADMLVEMTGDVPPTPPVRSREPSIGAQSSRFPTVPVTSNQDDQDNERNRLRDGSIDGVSFKETPVGSPEAADNEPMSIHNIDAASFQPPAPTPTVTIAFQHGVLARKFYSKRPPPISILDYLMRMHKYCPMSTAVYLATSFYITQLAVVEKIVPVTPRNVHRLLLAGLRVAMKALEDLSWPHSRFSKVGGVSELELGKLEITFCFLMDFTLKVDEKMLQGEAESLCRNAQGKGNPSAGFLTPLALDLPTPRKKRLLQEQQPAPENDEQNSNSMNNGNDTGNSNGNNGMSHTLGHSRSTSTAEKRKASSSLPMRPVHVERGIGIVGQS